LFCPSPKSEERLRTGEKFGALGAILYISVDMSVQGGTHTAAKEHEQAAIRACLKDCDVSEGTESAAEIRAIHLTDLHFTSSTFLDGQATPAAKAANAFRENLIKHLLDAKGDAPVHLVLVTGDLVDSEAIGEESHAKILTDSMQFLQQICEKLDVHPQALIVIPGNHDMKWKGIFGTRFWQKQHREHFRSAFPDFDVHRYFPKIDLLVACFDSNKVVSWGELASGAVDLEQLRMLRGAIALRKGWREPRYRIALVHHHPLPVPPAELLEVGDSRLDRFARKRVVGSVETMLLRNGGKLIQSLVKDRFQLVLHGHFHCTNYWGPVYGVLKGDHWVEVISGASLCKERGVHSFGLVTLSGHGGAVRYESFSFAPEDTECAKSLVTEGDYERVRARLAESLSSTAAVRCVNNHTMREVFLPDGDILSTEVYSGLKSNGDKPVSSLEMRSIADAMTRQDFTATIEQTPERLRVVRVRADDPRTKQKIVRYTLNFHPPLTSKDSVNLVVQRRTVGGVFSSQEAQKWWGCPIDELGYDVVAQRITWPCDRYQLSLRFRVSDLEKHRWKAPRDITVSAKTDIRESKEESEYVAKWLTYWSSSKLEPSPLRPQDEAEGILSMRTPLPDYRYALRWNVDLKEPIDGPTVAAITNMRRVVLALEFNQGRASAFLKHVMSEVRAAIRKVAPGADAEDLGLHVAVFGIDATKVESSASGWHGALVRAVASEPSGAALSGLSLLWGRDIIGRAARQGRRVSLERPGLDEAVEILHDLPRNIQFLIAQPLFKEVPDRFPAAVVAVASTSENSGLRAIIHQNRKSADMRRRLETSIQTYWLAKFAEITGGGP
jgi:3',5'-cyclic AMP phosphodiesterase CpdA